MKNIYALKISAICLAAGTMQWLSSCSDTRNDTLPQLSQQVYTGLEQLDLEYDGSPMVGKSVSIIPGTSTVPFTFYSKIDPASLSDALAGIPEIPGPGVLPGSPSLTIPVYLQPDGDEYDFSGSGTTEYVTYSYSGDITDRHLDFEFENIRLKDLSLAGGIWKPAPIQAGISSPLHIIWETSQPGLLENFDGTIQDALRLLADLPVIPVYGNTAYMSLAQVVAGSLKTIAFNPDGNLVVSYLQRANGAAQYAQAPLCMLQYLPAGKGKVRIFVNPTDLVSVILMNNTNKPNVPSNPFGSPARSTRASGSTSETSPVTPEQIAAIVTRLAPLASEGIPMAYSSDGNKFEIYLDSEFIVPLVKEIIAPVLADPVVQGLILAKLESDPSLKPYIPAVKAVMVALPMILETTTRAELGFSFVKV